MVWLSSLLRGLLRRLSPALRDDSRGYVEALLAEAEEIPPGPRQVAWLLGGLRFLASERRGVHAALYAAGLAVAAAGLLELNAKANADVGGPICMALLLLESAVLGAAAPRRAWISGTVVGAALGVSSLATIAAGGSLPATMHPPTTAGAASLLVLVVPALVAAHAAAALRRLVG